jgi:hypothetical protein
MTIEEFEAAVWETEKIRIVIRSRTTSHVVDYDYQNAAQETWRISQWLANRVQPKVGQRKVVVLGGDGEMPHGRTVLRTLRNSYLRGNKR